MSSRHDPSDDVDAIVMRLDLVAWTAARADGAVPASEPEVCT